MSEFQNKAVRLMAGHGEDSLSDLIERQRKLLFMSFELYRALGGSFDQLEAILMRDEPETPRRIDLVIGDLMGELAAIGYIYDLDIMQAAHNTLDRRREGFSFTDS
ncbi:hypothetical protein [Sinorhizobium americanum]|uniref:NTP pyrophosphohydrolase MazG putative catalytic core domain-containing protein n=1 Tax=Sinorhizobium americanum TaxID=194963 RepID=A0A4R2C2E3_9HYPH|nr:hypothetical protein [Sinorhizobium americanum]TCN33753.1 hypothetical protein EV184_10259 [Sinorhizobium americanum]